MLRPKNSRKCGTLSEVREKNAPAAMIDTHRGPATQKVAIDFES